MIIGKKIRAGKETIDAVVMPLGSKNLIVLKGSRGYVMCGYLNLAVAKKLKEAAIKVTGVSTIEEARNACVFSCSPAARKLGIYKGQPIKEVLKIIA